MLKILKIFENFENYDARQMRVISSGKCHVISHKKIQGHLLSCLWTANLKVPQSLSQWVSDQWVSDKVTYWAVCGQLKIGKALVSASDAICE